MTGGEPDGPTHDGRYLVVDGRRWRASDPGIPERLRAELVAELMAARRAVRDGRGDPDGVAAARNRVQDAKVALGERGEPWWDEASPDGRDVRLAAVMRSLLGHRDPGSTICPSDAARVVAGDRFRAVMEDARRVAAGLRHVGVVVTTQKGADVDPEGAHGPIRIGRGTHWDDRHSSSGR
ncbi:MAG: DUF3253 domain-containing protein [Lapillicoccus sp.]